MNINSSTPQVKIAVPQPKTPSTTPQPPESEGGKDSSFLRDVAAIGAGAGAGLAGGIYGLGEGLIKNGIENFPTHVSGGAKIGQKITTPVGGALGALATGVIVGAAAIVTPVAAVLSTAVGALGGTLVSALQHSPSAVVETAKKGAEIGARTGQGLGKVGETVGKYVGGAIGGIAGLGVALGRGIPAGLEIGKEQAKLGLDSMKALPTMAKETWNVAYPGGRKIAGSVGQLAGASTGLVTASGETLVEGMANSVKRGAQWGKAASDFVAGNKAEKPPEEKAQ